ncbi:hypothetical protein ACOME3_007265 [Neoechinorhynchus agilis]
MLKLQESIYHHVHLQVSHVKELCSQLPTDRINNESRLSTQKHQIESLNNALMELQDSTVRLDEDLSLLRAAPPIEQNVVSALREQRDLLLEISSECNRQIELMESKQTNGGRGSRRTRKAIVWSGLDIESGITIPAEIGKVNAICEQGRDDICEKLKARFSVVFNGNNLDGFKDFSASLVVPVDTKPIRLNARRIPFALQESAVGEINRLVCDGVLVPVNI